MTGAAGPSLGERRLAEDTRARFLREIVSRVPLGRLAAVHLFRPIRQGGYESGIAVIAAEPTVEATEPPTEEPVERAEAARDDATTGPGPSGDALAEPACDPTDAAAGAAPVAQPEATDPAAGPPADEPADEPAEEPRPDPRPPRHTVFTARYRLAIKGADRGRWEVEVVEEADAPMVTVEAVVRGVQRRAGEDADPERLDAAAVARLVGAPT